MTEEEKEAFFTEGGTVCEVSGLLTLKIAVISEVAQNLTPREKALQLLQNAIACLGNSEVQGEILSAQIEMEENKYTPAVKVEASEELLKEFNQE